MQVCPKKGMPIYGLSIFVGLVEVDLQWYVGISNAFGAKFSDQTNLAKCRISSSRIMNYHPNYGQAFAMSSHRQASSMKLLKSLEVWKEMPR
jgi:hypothetical protein